MSRPYRGQIKINSYSAEVVENPLYMAEKIPIIVHAFWQWDGKKWVELCEFKDGKVSVK